MAIAREGVTRPGNRTRLTDCFSQFFHIMTDIELWNVGTRQLATLYDRLSGHTSRRLGALLDGYRQGKEEALALTLAAGSALICRDCGGQCCLNGKYRLSNLDLLAHLHGEASLPLPDFDARPLCPYGNLAGCAMKPAFRPLDCVLFICDALEGLIEEKTAARLALLEEELRGFVGQAEALLEMPLGRPLLLSAAHIGADR
jgi:hypothetical protein